MKITHIKNLLFILLLAPTLLRAQHYTRTTIQHRADSFLLAYTRHDILAHSKWVPGTGAYSTYTYTNRKGKLKYTMLPWEDSTYTTGNFAGIKVWYDVTYPYPKCAIADTIRTHIIIDLDGQLELRHTPDISVIPDYVWENDSCKNVQ